ncbi:acetyl-CoA acetyltransferase [Sneathiella sp. P13V-1]|uniref:acetyl-CoA acetyltransferase n=1 Tax=Sneathiella sp. P13V-1 TaxID=2697366 RepID=UPI00187B7768|nr:acetyl-CoA acetyltransferase [Sneathiella sp. P13V-1]MBE7637496.1 acetyl-CoA acetyltransferase [Sneathiella sp. P13V-1]
MPHKNTPILVGVGDITEKGKDLEHSSSPMDLMEQAVRNAASDAEVDIDALQNADVISVVKSLYPFTKNPPYTLAGRLGIQNARHIETPIGGNMPQFLVNKFSEEIAEGKIKLAIFAGTEAMDTGRKHIKAGAKPDWREDAPCKAEEIVEELPMATEHEKAHGIWPARNVYPLFENAHRGRYGNSIADHQLEMGELFSKFSEVAAETDTAWFPMARSAEEVAFPSDTNRMVGWPYTKFMNAMNQVNQAAALILTSVEHAKDLGIPEEKWVYLHGCADVNEKWHVSHRVDYSRSPAIKVMGERAFSMAKKTPQGIDYFDLYSCFPVAVEAARDALGIPKGDPRPLTVTGGLPYHGGAGSYVINAIAMMVRKLRSNRGKFGMVTANGGYLSEHAAGIYSTEPTGEEKWSRTDPAIDQQIIDDLPAPEFIENPEGPAVIETYTVASGRDGRPNLGIIIGRLGDGSDANAPRFIANTPVNETLLNRMMEVDYLGHRGYVKCSDNKNTFTPE